MTRLAVLCLLSLGLLLPAGAQAAKLTIGSDLSAQASIAQSHNIDWAAWPAAFATGGGGIVAPAGGEVSMVQFKGTVLKPSNDSAYGGQYPPFNFLVTVMRPQPDGSVKMMVATQDLVFPFGGDPQQITTIDLQQYESRMCVQPGDYVALATSGGFGTPDSNPVWGEAGGMPDDYFANGYRVQMFARQPGSAYHLFEQPAVGGDDGNGFQVGDTERGSQQPGQELLMRATIGTGPDARSFCRTAEEENQATRPRVTVPEQPVRLKVGRTATVPVTLACVSFTPCTGTAYLKQASTGAPVGSGAISIASGATAQVPVRVNANGLNKLKQASSRKLAVTLIVRPKGGARVEAPFRLVKRP